MDTVIKSIIIIFLSDMLELGKHSKKLHRSIGAIINQTRIDKVFVKGKKIIHYCLNQSQNSKEVGY